MRRWKKTVLTVISLAGIVSLVAVGMWMRHGSDGLLMRTSPRPIIMSTFQFHLTAVVRSPHAYRLKGIFDAAEAAARTVARRMNIYDPDSELSRFNVAPAGQVASLSEPTLEVLTRSSSLWNQTDQAFDVTILPLVRLWSRSGKDDRLPSDEQVREARNASRWSFIELQDAGARKTVGSAGVDLGGIAKGYAIDQAARSMIQAGCVGGVVDIGGDVRCFGRKPSRTPWRVGIVDPFDPDDGKPFAVLAVRNAAVCTSGNYRRFRVIQGKHYSHILDPRTGMPVEAYPSVTVVAPDAATADAWATALSVLGPKGLDRLAGTNIEALIVVGTKEKHAYVATPGMGSLFVEWPEDFRAKK